MLVRGLEGIRTLEHTAGTMVNFPHFFVGAIDSEKSPVIEKIDGSFLMSSEPGPHLPREALRQIFCFFWGGGVFVEILVMFRV